MTPEDVTAMFTRADGSYGFARWGRPIVPVVFGVDEATLAVVKGAIEAVTVLSGHKLAETDPELGANFMLFFFRDWSELREVPSLGKMIPGLDDLVARLSRAEASQYRAFRFDEDGAIQACFTFVRVSGDLAELPAEAVALSQAVLGVLTWSDAAFAGQSPLALHPESGATVLRPEIAGVIRAAYDPVMPAAADDASHALRLFARIGAG